MKYLNFILIFFSVLLLSQETSFPIDFKIKSSSFPVKTYEQSTVNIYYNFSSIDKQDSQFKSFESMCILQIGNNFSKFTDRSKLRQDSLMSLYSHKDYVGAGDIKLILKYRILWSGTTIKDLKNKKIIQQNIIAGRIYQYEESDPTLNWDLQADTKDIMGYTCHKATVKYRGRNYVAWYASEIPLNNGPYVFQGLPGLVLEIEDEDKFVHFTAQGIDKKQMNIYLEDSNSIIKTTREKYREVRKNYFDNPGAFYHGKAYNVDGTAIITKSNPSKFYNPLELQ